MKPSFRKPKNASTPPRESPSAPSSAQRRGKVPNKFDRRGAAGSRAAPHAVELTRVQQIEAKAARDAVLAAAPRASPAAAKKFVESISLDVDVEAARQLALPGKALTALPSSIGVLCQQLRKLDVSGNDLTDLSPLASLQHLSNLNVSRNPRLASLKGLSGTCLSVLNISFCAVESLAGLEHTALTLRTLIANDNRLQFQSSVFGDDHVVAAELSEEEAAALASARQHLPASLRQAVKANTTALRNYALFRTFQQCETVVLSRNTQLAKAFPTWGAEELAAACGDAPRHAAARDSAEDSGSDTPADDARGLEGNARRGAGADAAAGAARKKSRADGSTVESGDEGDATNKEVKEAVALAHPLSVFDRLPRLKKLSLSGCELHSLPSRWFLPMVTELRLAQNHLTSLQPDGVILRSLHILDISNNLFMSVITLRRCRYLEQLNIRGNPLLDEAAVQDTAAGLTAEPPTKAEPAAQEGEPAHAAAAVPVSVQQRVVRLFPSIKLLDNQPVLSPEQLRAAYKRSRDAATATDAAAAEAAEAHDAEGVDPTSQMEVLDEKAEARGAPPAMRSAGATEARGAVAVRRGASHKVQRVDPSVIAAEADEKDVVVEAPTSVLKTAHAPIVRRERVLLRPGASSAPAGKSGNKKNGSGSASTPAPTVFGQAAVNKLLEQNRKTTAW